MRIVEWIGIGFLLGVLLLLGLFIRREIIGRRGTIELSLRLNTFVRGRGWSPGVARFVGDELRWYRVFSFAPRPKRVLRRDSLVINARRQPNGTEQLSLPSGWTVLSMVDRRGPVEVAMAPSTFNGFLSWLESAPPGTSQAWRVRDAS
jgi:hypothetical protein